jgi:membrane-bound metal-dependent hydrolase YbcI (DUF457 family)
MPFTPFHLGPALLIGLILFNYLDLPTFLIANIIIDIEPLTILLLGLDSPLHGFFHSFLGGTLASIFLTMIVLRVRKFASPLMEFFYREQNWSRRKILSASISGVYLHVFLDSFLYTDIRPFYSFRGNPLLSGLSMGFTVYYFCVFSGVAGLIIYLYKRMKMN